MIYRGKLEKVLKEATTYMESKYPKTDNPFAYHFVAFEPRKDFGGTYLARMKENLDAYLELRSVIKSIEQNTHPIVHFMVDKTKISLKGADR